MARTSSARLVLSFSLASLGVADAQSLAPTSPPPSIAAPSTQAQAAQRADVALAQALASNPITAPYRLTVYEQGRKVVLAGRVGDSRVHDVAVRTAIAMGIPVSDQLVIDTAAGYVAAQSSGPWTAPQGSIVTSYTYPPPLFGRYDEPFFGLEPPLVSYAPWFGAASRFRQAQDQPIAPPQQQAAVDPASQGSLPPNTIEAAIDPRGVATLRGVVPSDAARIEIGQRLARMPGVTEVVNRLTVGPLAANVPTPRRRDDDMPPPPPTPSPVLPRRDPDAPMGQPIRPDDREAPAPAPAPAAPARAIPPMEARPAEGISGRIDRAIQSLPELAGQPVKVSVRDGVATLSGTVPSVYEAMLAYRAVQQTPGVRSIVDTLAFTVPDGTTANPLLARARPDDIEPYLEAQVRRQVGDAAHIDRVRLVGDQVMIQGTLEEDRDRPRVEAILRSMPILRGFKILPEFRTSQR